MSQVFIPIGFNCDVKGTIRRICDEKNRKFNIYKDSLESFPFDWCLTFDINGLLDCIENRFDDILDIKYLKLSKSPKSVIEGKKWKHPDVINTKYNIIFPHHFNLKLKDLENKPYIFDKKYYLYGLEDIKNDFQRKIDRFYESLKKIDSIIFIRRTVDLNSYKTCCKEFDEIKNLNFNNEEKTLKMRLNKIFQEYNIKIKILNNWNEINNYLIHRY